MAQIVLSENLNVGLQELQQIIRFVQTDGYMAYLRANSLGYGLIRNVPRGNFNNFRVTPGDLTNKTLNVDFGYAFDNLGRLILSDQIAGLSIPSFNTWYWIKVKYAENILERGTVSVNANGTVIGTDTEFTRILQGGNRFPANIRFWNADGTPATLNGSVPYEVLTVDSDTQLTLNAVDLLNETNLKYSVYGTFTRGFVPDAANTNIYRYDGCEVAFAVETTLNTPPAWVGSENDENTFWIARVRKTTTEINVQDKRTKFWQTGADFLLEEFLDFNTNPIVGVESIKWMNADSARDENIVRVGWGLRATGWGFLPDQNFLDISIASGGRFTDVAQIAAAGINLPEWRLYFSGNSEWLKITGVFYPNPTTMRVILSNAPADYFADTTQTLYIVPNAEMAGFRITPSSVLQDLGPYNFEFPIKEGYADIRLSVQGNTQLYNVKWRTRNFLQARQFVNLPDTTAGQGYYAENQFNENGFLTGSTRTSYTNGNITLTQAADSFANFRATVDIGDLAGVQAIELSNAQPYSQLIVGTTRQTVFIVGAPFTASTGLAIALMTAGAVNGNKFTLVFRQGITLGPGGSLTLRQNGTSPTTGTVLRTFSNTDLFAFTYLNANGFAIDCYYDGTNWQIVPPALTSISTGWINVTDVTTIGAGFVDAADIPAFAGVYPVPRLSFKVLYDPLNQSRTIRWRGILTRTSGPTTMFTLPTIYAPLLSVFIGGAASLDVLSTPSISATERQPLIFLSNGSVITNTIAPTTMYFDGITYELA